jgi:hypothetical protein
MSIEVEKIDTGLRITIDNPIERQTVIVEELSRNIVIKGIIHTTGRTYLLHINDGHLSDLIAALQEIRNRRSEPAKRG